MSRVLALHRDSGVEAAWGLAFDEAMAQLAGLAELPLAHLRLYDYADHAVLVGRYQRLEDEVDLAMALALGVSVNRRPTGGGAILMGRDQLGVALALPVTGFETPREGMSRFARGVIEALGALGVRAELRGKNDIEVEGRKIAGVGFCRSGEGLLFHASILADLDADLLLSLLRIPLAKIAAHGGRAVEERITTLSALGVGREALEEALVASFSEQLGLETALGEGHECVESRAAVLAGERYATESWLFAQGAAAAGELSVELRSSLGTLRIIAASQGDIIKSAVVAGDFNEVTREIRVLEEALRWTVLEPGALERHLASTPGVAELADPAGIAAELCAAHASHAEAAGPRRIGSCYIPEEITL
ncbi:MAG: biotin/lipoate A/B protein ligase family protein [Actinomycetota bacterium]|nr:biotin/lipoate A/B protein ligase family protein [Actinomycetota bacterium]